MDDADIFGGMANDDRNERNRRRESRARTFIIGGGIAFGLYVPPIHFADDVLLVGYASKLRTGSASVTLYGHEDESFGYTFGVSTTNDAQFDVFEEELVAGEPLRLAINSGSSAADLSVSIFFI